MPSFDVQARIAKLYIYPVKSCAGIELSESVLFDTGLDLDRAWMVVDEDGEFVTQREVPRLALVQPALKGAYRDGGGELVLRAPGMLALHLRIDAVEQSVRARVWNDEVSAYDMGDIAAQWFTDFLNLGQKFRLVRFDPEYQRLSNKKWTGGVDAPNQFSDGYPLLVLSQSAVDELNERLKAAGEAPVDARRFRPNVLLADLPAHDEDQLGPLSIETDEGAAVLTPVKPCTRCQIPNINPDTAESHPAVNDTLQAYRQDARMGGALTFGMNAIVSEGFGQVLRVGQTVRADYRFGG